MKPRRSLKSKKSAMSSSSTRSAAVSVLALPHLPLSSSTLAGSTKCSIHLAPSQATRRAALPVAQPPNKSGPIARRQAELTTLVCQAE
eukprot:CAMPEP_0177452696 /NCGR_PEP_ID=MMETSP0369-20130122/10448_1 /TAXON_ID=447022 ORGANISM="Scrippsiella hangoei-like, Strain SHHI-4" /NCGR_SAMPLE_ID=MMETSP0369 /ASSEMBLY_ACC=CAM_ASM_000364 /LENGTH=87 /DNA_ID=CAMNT_0018925391 /DNA_START=277 /DNA_END=541 /DNA_ORIENTATION=-